MQGSQAQINAWVSQAPVIYSRLFHWPSETGACGGGGGGGGGFRGRPLFVLSQASTIGQRARGWGCRGYRPDFCLCAGGGVTAYRGKKKRLASERKGSSGDLHTRFSVM